MLKAALVGSSGFVGSNLSRLTEFDGHFRRATLDQLRGRLVETLVLAAMRAEKWIVNARPEEDLASLEHLLAVLETVSAERVFAVSTVDVYPVAVGIDETTMIDRSLQSPYGRHRLLLEEGVRRRFPQAVIFRLPGLFGPGLKKNALYDLLHDNELDKVNAEGRYQFYDVRDLWRDFERAERAAIRLLNVATEPVTIRDVARRAYGMEFDNRPPGRPAEYDMRTIHDADMGGAHGYLRSRDEVLGAIESWVREERASTRDGGKSE